MLLTCQGAIGVKVGALTVATTVHLSNKKELKKTVWVFVSGPH